MATLEQARSLALALPEAAEQPHHGFPSFRVRGKIFATVPDDGHLHVMLGEVGIRVACRAAPEACEEKWWGKTLSAVRVSLDRVDDVHLGELLEAAWRRRAPTAVVKAFDASRSQDEATGPG